MFLEMNEGGINFSPFSRGNGLIEITDLCSPSVLFCKLKTSNSDFICLMIKNCFFIIF